jgi:hypothetical protein
VRNNPSFSITRPRFDRLSTNGIGRETKTPGPPEKLALTAISFPAPRFAYPHLAHAALICSALRPAVSARNSLHHARAPFSPAPPSAFVVSGSWWAVRPQPFALSLSKGLLADAEQPALFQSTHTHSDSPGTNEDLSQDGVLKNPACRITTFARTPARFLNTSFISHWRKPVSSERAEAIKSLL